MRKWIIIFSILIAIELLDELSPIFFPTFEIFPSLSLVVVLVTIFLLFIFVKGVIRTSKEFHKNQQKLSSIFDTLDVAIWSHDLETDKLLISPGIEKLYGYSLDEFYNDYELWKKVILPEDRVCFKRKRA